MRSHPHRPMRPAIDANGPRGFICLGLTPETARFRPRAIPQNSKIYFYPMGGR